MSSDKPAVRAIRPAFARSQPEQEDRPSLLDDTLYRRARRRMADVAHHVDERIRSWQGGPARILFEAASPMSLAVLRPVLDRLNRDTRLEFWYTSSDDALRAESIFATSGITERVITSDRARWMKFDAYINTDFWNMTWLRRRAWRIHFFHGVAGKYGLDAPTRIAPVVASFDRLMFANRDRLRKYAAAGLVDPDGPRAALVGYPKVDCLVDGTLDRRRIGRDLGLDGRRPTVLYAPTWSPHSSLNASGPALIDRLSRLDVNVIVKLHDRSLDRTVRGSGGVDWRRELARLRAEHGIHIAESADASPYMAAADVMVTDHSSIGFEYMLLDRPIIVVDCPELVRKAGVSLEKVALLRSAATVIDHPAQAGSAVAHSLEHPHRHGSARRAIAADLFYGAGGASDRAVASIYELLQMREPQIEVPAPAVSSALDAGADTPLRRATHA